MTPPHRPPNPDSGAPAPPINDRTDGESCQKGVENMRRSQEEILEEREDSQPTEAADLPRFVMRERHVRLDHEAARRRKPPRSYKPWQKGRKKVRFQRRPRS